MNEKKFKEIEYNMQWSIQLKEEKVNMNAEKQDLN